jgi:hypothetical protein
MLGVDGRGSRENSSDAKPLEHGAHALESDWKEPSTMAERLAAQKERARADREHRAQELHGRVQVCLRCSLLQARKPGGHIIAIQVPKFVAQL